MADYRRGKLAALIAAHLLVGLGMAAFKPLFAPQAFLPAWMEVCFMAMIASELLLLGVWIGFANETPSTKLIVSVAGMGWLAGLCCLAVNPRSHPELLGFCAFLGVSLASVVAVCVACRRWIVKGQWRSQWKTPAMAKELQFTLWSVVGMTTLIAVVLALGRIVRWMAARHYHLAVALMCALLIALVAALVVWTGLGTGRLALRVPLTLAVVPVLSLLPTYYAGVPWQSKWLLPVLAFITALYSLASLLVVRNCGYRLVPLTAAGGKGGSPS